MTNPAQRPPADASSLDLAMHALTEILVLSLSFLVGISLGMSLVWIGVIPESAQWAGIVLGSVSIGSAGLSYLAIEQFMARDGAPVRPLVETSSRKPPLVCVGIALIAVVVALAGSSLLSMVQTALFEVEVEEQDAILDLVRSGDRLQILVLGISAVVIAPMTEELLFRHMFFRRLLHRAGPTLAWILPALAFSAFHFNPSGLVIYVWLGLVFAFAYLYSGRLWVAMAVHAGHNALAFAALVWLPEGM